jgi:hypothetical protein
LVGLNHFTVPVDITISKIFIKVVERQTLPFSDESRNSYRRDRHLLSSSTHAVLDSQRDRGRFQEYLFDWCVPVKFRAPNRHRGQQRAIPAQIRAVGHIPIRVPRRDHFCSAIVSD